MSSRAGLAVHAAAARATSGGGMTYVTALAAALADLEEVDLFLAFASSPEELAAWMRAWPRQARVRREPPNRSWRDELRLALDDRRWAVVVRETSAIPRLSLGRRSVLVTSFPFSSVSRIRDPARVASYAAVVTNSAFSAHWVGERWGRDAAVLHPPVTSVTPKPKRPTILSVGRFSGGGRSKRQVEMVDALRALGPTVHREWDLQLAGFVEDASYLSAVRDRALGLPVTIHADLDRRGCHRGRPAGALRGLAPAAWTTSGLPTGPVTRCLPPTPPSR